MPKQKTNKSVAKRVKVTANGRIKISRPSRGHLKSAKSSSQLRGLRKRIILNKSFEKAAKKLLGLG
jgi:large subunit ribosomal protein L35